MPDLPALASPALAPAELDPPPAALARLVEAYRKPAPPPAAPMARAKKLAVDLGHALAPESLPARIAAAGHFKTLQGRTVAVLQRLSRPDDRADYMVRFNASAFPEAFATPTGLMRLNLGLLSLARSEDEYAAVIAQKMSYANPEQFKAAADSPENAKLLERLEGYRDMPALQREILRSDIAGVERMAKAGYNPWAAYEHHKRMAAIHASLSKRSWIRWIASKLVTPTATYLGDMPAPEIRMAAIKAYILKQDHEKDTTDLVERREPLPASLRLLRLRVRPFTALALSPIFYWATMGYFALKTLMFLGALLVPDQALALMERTDQAQGMWARFADSALGFARGGVSTIGLGRVWEWVSSHGGEIGAALGIGYVALFAGVVVVSMFQGYRMDPFRRLYRTVFAERRALVAPRAASGGELIAGLESGRLRLHDIQLLLLQRNSAVRSYRLFDGLLWNRWRWPWLYQGMLEELESRVPSLGAAERAALAALLRAPLPPFAAEHRRLRESWLRLAAAVHTDLPADHVVSLVADADRLIDSGDSEAALRLVPRLSRAGLYDTIERLYRRRRGALFAAAIAPKAGDTALAENWIDGERIIRERRTLKTHIGPLREWRRERSAIILRLRYLFSPLDERLAAAALLDRLPLLGAQARWRSPRWRLMKLDHRLLRLQLAWSFGSVKELAAFLNGRVKPRGVPSAAVRPLLHGLVAARPRMIKGAADLDALLATDELWPQLGEHRGGEMETLMLEVIERNAKKLPGPWSYEPAKSETMHALYLRRQEELGLSPVDAAGRAERWKKLTERGVTSATDREFTALMEEAEGPLRVSLEDAAIAGHIWDPAARAGIAERRLREGGAFKALLAASDPRRRMSLLTRVVGALQKDLPDRGVHYADLLERLSNEILSSPDESGWLQRQKTPPGKSGERSEDASTRVLTKLFEQTLTWRKSEQWALLKFLRGDAPPTRKVRRAFQTVGPERVKRFYDTLPLAARVGLVDTFLDSPKGLAGKVSARRGWSGVIVGHVLPEGNPEARRVARDMLEAFLYGLEKTGNTGYQSFVLAYMLALPKSETASVGKTLKGVLEILGATGVKIGQFLAASRLLDDETAAELSDLRERAMPPEREASYQDLREASGMKKLPFILLRRLGSASIKYSHLARERSTGDEIVLKAFRLSAQAHTRQEFARLEHMAAFLTKRHGPRYGALRAIISAAKKAVARELSAEGEVARSDIARTKIYAGRGTEDVEVQAPRDVRLADRLIASEFAEGISPLELPDEERRWASETILALETDVLFGPTGDEAVDFDPDRHPGNYRALVKDGRLYVRPIDPGQGLTIKGSDRDRIVSLIAVAQVLRDSGSAKWAAEELGRLLSHDSKTKRRVRRALLKYFPDRGLAREAAYFTLLAALDDAGAGLDAPYFDFVRGIVQFREYEKHAPGFAKTPQNALTSAVVARAEEYRPAVKLTARETLAYGRARAADAFYSLPGMGGLGARMREPRFARLARFALAGALALGLGAARPDLPAAAADWAGGRVDAALAELDRMFPSYELQFERGFAEVPPEKRDQVLWELLRKVPGDEPLTMRIAGPDTVIAGLRFADRVASGESSLSGEELKELVFHLGRHSKSPDPKAGRAMIKLADAALARDDRQLALAALEKTMTFYSDTSRVEAARKLAALAAEGKLDRAAALEALGDAAENAKSAGEKLMLVRLAMELGLRALR